MGCSSQSVRRSIGRDRAQAASEPSSECGARIIGKRPNVVFDLSGLQPLVNEAGKAKNRLQFACVAADWPDPDQQKVLAESLGQVAPQGQGVPGRRTVIDTNQDHRLGP